MSAITKINDLMGLVERLLREHERFRDDDKRLTAKIWSHQVGLSAIKSISLFDFMVMYIDNPDIATPDSISRARRKVQEKFPELRGKKYRERIAQQIEVRNNITKM